MKKFFLGIVLLLLLILGFLGWQRYQAHRNLSELARGRTYSNFGIKLEIPPDGGKVRGWIKPYLDLPRVIVDLASWKIATPLTLENGRIQAPLWKRGGFLLTFPRSLNLPADVKVDGLSFELVPEASIRKVSAASIERTTPDGNETFRVERPEIFMGSWVGWLPDRVGLEIFRIKTGKKPSVEAPAEELELKALTLSLVSELRGAARPWKIYGALGGGKFSEKSAITELLPFEFKWTGTSQEVSLAEIVKNYLPGFQQLASLSDPAQAMGLIVSVKQLLLRLQPQLNSMDFYFEGVKHVNAQGVESLSVRPLKGVMQTKFSSREGLSQGKVHWEGLSASIGTQWVQLENLDVEQSAQYRDIDYVGLLTTILDHYAGLLTSDRPDSFEAMQKSLWYSFAQYPNTAEAKMKVARVHWTGPDQGGEVKDAVFAFKLAADRWDYSINAAFSHRDDKDPLKTIEGAKVDLQFDFKLPWEKIIGFFRQPNAESQSMFSLVPLFAGQLSGLDWKWRIDLGENLFVLNLDFIAEADVAELMAGYGQVDPKSGISISEQMQKNLLRSAINRGHLSLKIGIDRFSKFQAALDRVQSGASLGLAVLAPYIVIDAKADSLRADLELKDARVLVNGKPEESLEKFLLPFK